MTKIILKTSKFVKNPNTKTSYILTETETQEVTEQQHKNATCKETMQFFKRLGGSEGRVFAYTCNGYKCIKSTSISPDRQSKTVREYEFIYSEN